MKKRIGLILLRGEIWQSWCEKRLVNGLQVYVEGRLQSRGWEDSNGRKHFRTEVVAHELIAFSNVDR